MENKHLHRKEPMWKRTPVPKWDAGRQQPVGSGSEVCLMAKAYEPAKHNFDEPDSDWCMEPVEELGSPGWE